MIRQGSPEWLAARRDLITATDISVLLGINPYRSEQDLADEKRGIAEPFETNIRMRIGTALEPLIADEYTRATGRKLRRYHGLLTHPTVTWAGASPDFGVIGERRLVETKWTGSRARFADGLPQDIEAQAMWQMFVTGIYLCDVAALVGDDLKVFTVEFASATAQGLMEIAADFRARLAAGGPFAQNAASIKRRFPSDSGIEIQADADLAEAVHYLIGLREQRRQLESFEEQTENAIKTRVGDASTVLGMGWHLTWKRTKDRTETDWRTIAEQLLATLPETDRTAIVGRSVVVRPGFRPLRITLDKED